MHNSFGHLFRVTTFGESHGPAIGAVIDGCPAGLALDMSRLQAQMHRRRPGQSALTTARRESDEIECLSGLGPDGKTLGSPLTLLVRNNDARSEHYQALEKVYRPSHADYVTEQKYGVRMPPGGGRASARETAARVMAGAVAEQVLETLLPSLRVCAFVSAIKDIAFDAASCLATVTRETVDRSSVRCPDAATAADMKKAILAAKMAGDSLGGIITGVIRGVPPGLGDPVFDKLEANLARAMLSIPACKGFDIGSGFAGTQLLGSEHNDAFILRNGVVATETNRSGGIQGGISNGEMIYFRVAFKPTATIFKPQQTLTRDHEPTIMQPKEGRHDPCVLPRAVPIVEAMTSLVIVEHALRQRTMGI